VCSVMLMRHNLLRYVEVLRSTGVSEQEMASRTMKRVAQRTTSTYMRSAEGSGVRCIICLFQFTRSHLEWPLIPLACSAIVKRWMSFKTTFHSLTHLLLFIIFSHFPFLIHFTNFLLLSIRSLSTRIVPLRFQA